VNWGSVEEFMDWCAMREPIEVSWRADPLHGIRSHHRVTSNEG
jgi:hypothetical protein